MPTHAYKVTLTKPEHDEVSWLGEAANLDEAKANAESDNPGWTASSAARN